MTLSNTKQIETVIFDWAGTIVDFGSLAPVLAFQELFAKNDVEISLEEAREPMGTEKREHIRRLFQNPVIADRWFTAHGCMADEAIIDRLYNEFVPIQLETIKTTAKPIPGFTDTLGWLAQAEIQVATNTGYAREMLNTLIHSPDIEALEFNPVSTVCAPEVPRGRPFPDMSLANLLQAGSSSVKACVKVDDTVVGIEEGINAGMWTVGVAISGNACGLTESAYAALADDERESVRKRAYEQFAGSGAHFVIDSVAELPGVIEEINQRLREGENP